MCSTLGSEPWVTSFKAIFPLLRSSAHEPLLVFECEAYCVGSWASGPRASSCRLLAPELCTPRRSNSRPPNIVRLPCESTTRMVQKSALLCEGGEELHGGRRVAPDAQCTHEVCWYMRASTFALACWLAAPYSRSSTASGAHLYNATKDNRSLWPRCGLERELRKTTANLLRSSMSIR